MPKYQKAGLIMSAATFICLGLVFIIIGLKYDIIVLKYMGSFWFPAGLLQLVLVLFFIYKKKTSA